MQALLRRTRQNGEKCFGAVVDACDGAEAIPWYVYDAQLLREPTAALLNLDTRGNRKVAYFADVLRR
jgi:hypothetical protein